MATSALSTVANPVSTSSSAAPASTSPSFVWQPIGEMFTCGQTNIRWAYTGSPSPLTLNITNINVTQQAPLSSIGPSSTSQAPASAASASSASPSLARRQFNGYGGSYLPSVNEIFIAGIDPTLNNFTWTSVIVPQGWYQIYANVQNTVQATSASFYVQNGTNTNCVPQFAAGVPVPATSASASSTSHVAVATGTSSPSSAQSGHSHAGAIAGGVVGGLALLAVVAAIFLCFLRRSPSRTRLHDEDSGGRRWSELSFRKVRSGNARSSLQNASNGHAEQTIIGSDEEISTVGHEKAIAAAQAAAHPPPQQPIRTQSFRTSTQTSGSYRDGRVTTNPERRGSRDSYGVHPGEVIAMEPTNLQHSPSIASPRRKPAPRYDGATEAGERDGRSSSQTTLDPPVHGNSTNGSPDSVHILQHKGSFGAVRPMHVMVSDPPPAVRP
jgi:hypothetical protein